MGRRSRTQRTKRHALGWVAAISAVLILAACGGSDAAPTAPPANATPTTTAASAARPTGATQPSSAAQPTAAGASSVAPTTAAATPAPVAAAATPAPAAGTPKRGGTAVVVMNADPGPLNPAITTAGGTHTVTDQIFNGLVGLDDKLNPVPELAASWTISADGKTYAFKLVPGVMWHDGQPFSSDDVKFTFEQGLLKFHARTKAALEGILDGIDAPDPGTVIFRFKQPYGPFLQRLDVVEASIIPRHIYDGKDLEKDPATAKPIGTGPFKFTEYIKGDHVTLDRNPTYFKTDASGIQLPYLDKAILRIIPNVTTAEQALQQGEVDYLGSISGADLPQLQKDPSLTLVQGFGGSGGSVCQDVLIPNLAKKPFDTVAGRQAFYTAIDRKFIVDQVYFNQGVASTGPISSQMAWAYTPQVHQYPFDATLANQMFDQAGYPKGADGTRLTITFTNAASYAKLGDALRQQLKAVGINFQLETIDVNAANDKVFVKKDFDLGVASYCNGSDPEVGVRRMYVSSNIGPILFSNGAGYKNPKIDQLFDQGAAQTDRADRTKTYAQIQQVLTDDMPYFWIIDSQGYRAYRSVYKGFRTSGGNILETAWTTK